LAEKFRGFLRGRRGPLKEVHGGALRKWGLELLKILKYTKKRRIRPKTGKLKRGI
jgi:hypothetical protein